METICWLPLACSKYCLDCCCLAKIVYRYNKILSKERKNKKHKMVWEEIALKVNLRSWFMWSIHESKNTVVGSGYKGSPVNKGFTNPLKIEYKF